MCLYLDPAYPLRIHLQAPVSYVRLTPKMEALIFNQSMSQVRVSVEGIISDVVKSFKSMDFKNNLKIGLSSVGKMYIVCALIQNVITCLYGLSLPTIHEYFS